MFSRWLRLGIRTQITVMVLIGAVLTTAVTLLIADVSIRGYAIGEAQKREIRNLNIAVAIRKNSFGDSISVSSDNKLVIDSLTVDRNDYTTDPTYGTVYGKLALNDKTAFVDQISRLTDVQVSVYQCANQTNQAYLVNGRLCPRISTTFPGRDIHSDSLALQRDISSPDHPLPLSSAAAQQLGLRLDPQNNVTASQNQVTVQETIAGQQYLSGYLILTDPQNHMIGVLSVSEPLDSVNALINTTTLELIISGVIIMIGGIILALLVASTISGTLQRAATQLGSASAQLNNIAGQQAGGSRQQVWAINAINQALQNLQETSNDVSQRTDQLSQIGTQAAMRRGEIAPAQFESVMNYMTRSVRDISVASHQQTTTIERMSGAMQAVVEIADQVAGNSQQTSESAKRLDQVVGELEQLVTGKATKHRSDNGAMESMAAPDMSGPLNGRNMGTGMPMSNPNSRPNGMSMTGGPNGGYNMTGPGRGMAGPNMSGAGSSRPMLPSPARSQSRPSDRSQGNWDQMDDGSMSYGNGNNPPNYGAQPPRPNRDQGRNNR